VDLRTPSRLSRVAIVERPDCVPKFERDTPSLLRVIVPLRRLTLA